MKNTAYGFLFLSWLWAGFATADEWASLATRSTIENDRICYSDATDIICDSNAPTLTDINSLVSGAGGLWTATGSDIYFTGGRVGIGRTNPTEPLHIHAPDQTDLTMLMSNDEGTNLQIGNVLIDAEEKLGLFSNEDLGLRANQRVNLRAGGSTWASPFTFELQNAMTKSGNYDSKFLTLRGTFAPTTNDGAFHGLDADFTINQTGTATGDYTALRLRLAKVASTGNGYFIRSFLGSSQNFAVTESGSILAAQLCDETGSNCSDLSAGLGGAIDADSLNFTELADSLILDATTNISTLTNDLTINTDDFVIDGATGNVGIGTASPASDTKLDVAGAIKIAATESETCAATEDLGKIRFNASLGKFQICRP